MNPTIVAASKFKEYNETVTPEHLVRRDKSFKQSYLGSLDLTKQNYSTNSLKTSQTFNQKQN